MTNKIHATNAFESSNGEVLIAGPRTAPTFINVLRLNVRQIYDCSYMCIDDNYDGAPDAGQQIIGNGKTQIEALADYFQYASDFELLGSDVNYIISGKDLIW